MCPICLRYFSNSYDLMGHLILVEGLTKNEIKDRMVPVGMLTNKEINNWEK